MEIFGGGTCRRTKLTRDVRYCLLALLVFCWQQAPVQTASWKDLVEANDSEEGYDDAEESNEEEEDTHETGEVDHYGVFPPHSDKESVEIEYEEHEHHLANGVGDSDGSSEDHSNLSSEADLLAHLSDLQKIPRGKKQKRGNLFGRNLAPPVTITVPYPVHIERKVPVFIETKVPVYVEKKVEVPVDRPYQVPVPVKVPVHEKEVIHVPKPIVFNVDRPYPVFVHRTVYVDKYRPFKVLIKSRTRY